MIHVYLCEFDFDSLAPPAKSFAHITFILVDRHDTKVNAICSWPQDAPYRKFDLFLDIHQVFGGTPPCNTFCTLEKNTVTAFSLRVTLQTT